MDPTGLEPANLFLARETIYQLIYGPVFYWRPVKVTILRHTVNSRTLCLWANKPFTDYLLAQSIWNLWPLFLFSLELEKKTLATVVRFERTIHRIKICCLTTWLHGNIKEKPKGAFLLYGWRGENRTHGNQFIRLAPSPLGYSSINWRKLIN